MNAVIFRALRLPFLSASILPLCLGIAYAWHDLALFAPLLGVLSLIIVVALHVGTNVSNDYFDQETDNVNKSVTPFSGGSRVIQEKQLNIGQVKTLFMVCYLIAIIAGAVLFWLRSVEELLWLGGLGLLLGFFYTASPFKLAYKGLGDVLVFLCFGPLLTLGAYIVQTGAFSWSAAFIGIPSGILTALILMINGFPDRIADKQAGKKTLVVRLGTLKTAKVYASLVGITLLSLLVLVFAGLLPTFSLISLLGLIMSIKAAAYLLAHHNKQAKKIIPGCKMTIGAHALTTLLMTISLVM